MTTELGNALDSALEKAGKDAEEIVRPLLYLTAIELPVNPGMIAFYATESFVAKVYSVSEEQIGDPKNLTQVKSNIHVRHIRFNPFKVKNGKVVAKGSLHPTLSNRFECPACHMEMVFDTVDEDRSRRRKSFYCAACAASTGKRHTLRYIEPVPPYFPSSTAKAMLDKLTSKPASEDLGIVPNIYGLYPKGSAPGVWEPECEIEEEAVKRYDAINRELRPFKMIAKIKGNPMVGLIGLGHPLNVGWISEAHFQKDGTDPGFTRRLPSHRPPKNQSLLV